MPGTLFLVVELMTLARYYWSVSVMRGNHCFWLWNRAPLTAPAQGGREWSRRHFSIGWRTGNYGWPGGTAL